MRFVPLLMLIMVGIGCHAIAQTRPATYPTTIPASQPAAKIGADQILVQFEPFDCPCALSDLNAALMSLNGVSSVKWDFDRDRVFMNFLDDRRPTDEEITRAIRVIGAPIRNIQRP